MKKVLTLLFVFVLAGCAGFDPYAAIAQPAPISSPTATTEPTPRPTATAPADLCTVTAAALHLRRGPGVSYAVIGYLYAGEIVTIESTRGAWLQVTTESGAGFIRSRYCRMD